MPVDLTARREQAHALAHEGRQALAALAHHLKDEQPRDHAAVAIGEFAEIMMCTHLAAVDAVDLAHLLLDKGMPGLAQHRHTAPAAHDVQSIPGEARIVDDAGARLDFQKGFRQQTHEVVAFDELPVLVKEEAAVVIAVPRQPDGRPGPAHDLRGGRLVLEEHGIRDAVRECSVRGVMDLDEFEGQVRLQLIDDQPGSAVARVDHDLQFPQFRAIDVTEEVCKVFLTEVQLALAAGRRGFGGQAARLDQRPHVLQARISADGPGVLADKLHSVVIGWVVTRGHHNPAVEMFGEGGEVRALRAA